MAGLVPIDPGAFIEYSEMNNSRRVLQNGTPEAKKMVFLEELLKNVFLKSFITQPASIFSDDVDDEDKDIISKENTSQGAEIYNMLIRDLLAKNLQITSHLGLIRIFLKD